MTDTHRSASVSIHSLLHEPNAMLFSGTSCAGVGRALTLRVLWQLQCTTKTHAPSSEENDAIALFHCQLLRPSALACAPNFKLTVSNRRKKRLRVQPTFNVFNRRLTNIHTLFPKINTSLKITRARESRGPPPPHSTISHPKP